VPALFWNLGVLLIHILEHGCTVTTTKYCATLKILQQAARKIVLVFLVMVLFSSTTVPDHARPSRLGSSTQEMLDHPPNIHIWHPAIFSVSHLKEALVRRIPSRG